MSKGEGDRKEALSKERAEALGLALTSSLGNVSAMWERQMSLLLAIAAVVAAMPETAAIDPKKVGVVIQLLTAKQGEPEKMRDETGKMASVIINLARRLRDFEPSSDSDVEGDRPPSNGAGKSG